jgi:cation diffusion facilitator CzcD-associated flavoprotein CzcO
MSYPVVVIGAGPVGLAAAAQLAARGQAFVILERGARVAENVQRWGHVRIFTPWRYAVDETAVALLEGVGWTMPDPDAHPTGAELAERYLAPLAAHPVIAPHLRLNAEVVAVARQQADKMHTTQREQQPFVVRFKSADGRQDELLARAVIDASGTYHTPNPLGANGLPALGEAENSARIRYAIPDVLGAERARYANKRVLVVGSGHSAFNALLELAALQAEAPDTQIVWAVRRAHVGQMFGGGASDQLAERGALGQRARAIVERGQVKLLTGVSIQRLTGERDGVHVEAQSGDLGVFDEIICVTGFRPTYELHRELRVSLDPIVEAPPALAPLIDPSLHSCGTVPPHGVDELSHPEPNFYVIGMKSYGRAPTFLMLTGYEQARSVVAALAGDWQAARTLNLVLPETGVCSTDVGSCCAPTPVQVISPFDIAIH